MDGLIRVCVVGAGISGLSTACNIQEQIPDVKVTIVADKFHPELCSSGPAGLWMPIFLSEKTDLELQRKWGEETFTHMKNLFLTEDAGDAGISKFTGSCISYTTMETPFWSSMVHDFHRTSSEEILMYGPRYKDGYTFTSYGADCTRYIPWLMTRFKTNGGEFYQSKLKTFQEAADKYDVVVNCVGLGSYNLIEDKSMSPIRGQVVRVRAPWVKFFLTVVESPNEITYILPGTDSILLGGTSAKGNWNMNTSLQDKGKIMERCCKLLPSLARAEFVEDWVGLRPNRDDGLQVKTDAVMNSCSKYIPLVHNYGHGGSGITFHWGCAKHATELVQRCIWDLKKQSKL